MKGFGFSIQAAVSLASLAAVRARCYRSTRDARDVNSAKAAAGSSNSAVGTEWQTKRDVASKATPGRWDACACRNYPAPDASPSSEEILGQPAQIAQELLMAMTFVTVSDDSSLQDIERSKQGGGAVTLIIVGHGSATTFFIGSPGCVRSTPESGSSHPHTAPSPAAADSDTDRPHQSASRQTCRRATA